MRTLLAMFLAAGVLEGQVARPLVRVAGKTYVATDERTGVKVRISVGSFLLGATEVTEAEYAAIAGAQPSGSLPVRNVSWWDAIRYCNLRSEKEHLQRCYDLATGKCDRTRSGYRLPTEAEWTLAAAAAKGDAVLGEAQTKHTGPLLERVRRGPKPVATGKANGLGIYDLFGNVWEWCDDFYDAQMVYPDAENPSGPARGLQRVVRGGSFATPASGWSKNFRSSLDPETRSRFTGFRVARTLVEPAPRREIDARWFSVYNDRPKGFTTSGSPLRALTEPAAELKKKWLEALGASEPVLERPALRIVERFQEPAYSGTLAMLQVEADAWEKILVMKPRRASQVPLPVVIVPYYDVDVPAGRDMGGRQYMPPGVRSYALLAVQAGYMAVAIQWFGEGSGESLPEAVAELALRHPQLTGLGKWVNDARVLVNFLYTQPDVDRERIAIMGHSLGGKMALYAGALDDRIAVTVASEPGIGFSSSNYEDFWYWGDRLATLPAGTDQHELLAIMAPRPFLLIAGDNADKDSSWNYIEAARPYYARAGDAERIGMLNHRTGHTPTPEAVFRGMEWIRHFFEVR